jgi:hypothetical protein
LFFKGENNKKFFFVCLFLPPGERERERWKKARKDESLAAVIHWQTINTERYLSKKHKYPI